MNNKLIIITLALIATINQSTQCIALRTFSRTAHYFITARSMSSQGGRWVYDSSGERIIGENPNFKPSKKKKESKEKKEWNSSGDWFKRKEKDPNRSKN